MTTTTDSDTIERLIAAAKLIEKDADTVRKYSKTSHDADEWIAYFQRFYGRRSTGENHREKMHT